MARKDLGDANELSTVLAILILDYAVKEGTSDIHFDPHATNTLVRFRIDGQLQDRVAYITGSFQIQAQLRVMANLSPRAPAAHSPEDSRFQVLVDGRPVQFRISSFPTAYGDKLVLRVLDQGKDTLNLERLGFLPPVLERLKEVIRSPCGIFLISGVTGSGKTTTLCSILKALSVPEVNIVTLEDPIEYDVPRVIHTQVNPRIGFTFAEGLRSVLRQDPDIIMVGEIRDLETAEMAFRAAVTGHLIFASVHATTATGVLSRLLSIGMDSYLVKNALLGSLAQRLIRRVCAQCAQPMNPSAELVEAIVRHLESDYAQKVRAVLTRPGGRFLRGKGCPACRMTGYKGRIGIFELLTFDDILRSFITEKMDVLQLRKAAVNSGMRTLTLDATEKVVSGIASLEDISAALLEV